MDQEKMMSNEMDMQQSSGTAPEYAPRVEVIVEQAPIQNSQNLPQQMPMPTQGRTDGPDMQNMKFCQHCGRRIPRPAVICTHCGCQVERMQTAPNMVVNQNYNVYGNPKDKWVAFVLCFFFGLWGVHRFYEGKVATGLLWLFTGGLFGLGWLIDLILILCKPNPYYV